MNGPKANSSTVYRPRSGLGSRLLCGVAAWYDWIGRPRGVEVARLDHFVAGGNAGIVDILRRGALGGAELQARRPVVFRKLVLDENLLSLTNQGRPPCLHGMEDQTPQQREIRTAALEERMKTQQAEYRIDIAILGRQIAERADEMECRVHSRRRGYRNRRNPVFPA